MWKVRYNSPGSVVGDPDRDRACYSERGYARPASTVRVPFPNEPGQPSDLERERSALRERPSRLGEASLRINAERPSLAERTGDRYGSH